MVRLYDVEAQRYLSPQMRYEERRGANRFAHGANALLHQYGASTIRRGIFAPVAAYGAEKARQGIMGWFAGRKHRRSEEPFPSSGPSRNVIPKMQRFGRHRGYSRVRRRRRRSAFPRKRRRVFRRRRLWPRMLRYRRPMRRYRRSTYTRRLLNALVAVPTQKWHYARAIDWNLTTAQDIYCVAPIGLPFTSVNTTTATSPNQSECWYGALNSLYSFGWTTRGDMKGYRFVKIFESSFCEAVNTTSLPVIVNAYQVTPRFAFNKEQYTNDQGAGAAAPAWDFNEYFRAVIGNDSMNITKPYVQFRDVTEFNQRWKILKRVRRRLEPGKNMTLASYSRKNRFLNMDKYYHDDIVGYPGSFRMWIIVARGYVAHDTTIDTTVGMSTPRLNLAFNYKAGYKVVSTTTELHQINTYGWALANPAQMQDADMVDDAERE